MLYKSNQQLQPASFNYSHVHNQSKNFTEFLAYLTNFSHTMSKCQPYTLREILAEVFVDKDSDLIQMLLIHYQIQESKCAKPVLKIVWK